jgi:sterol desaturase/sphingolipid hydroxylase (fatty acid hydroxylase superfamily)
MATRRCTRLRAVADRLLRRHRLRARLFAGRPGATPTPGSNHEEVPPMLDLLLLSPLFFLAAFLGLDLLGLTRARHYDAPRFWRLRGLAFTAVTVTLQFVYAGFWESVLGGRTLLDLSGLGIVPGAAVGLLVYELFHYGYHRVAHRFDWLWLLGHQVHHSAERMDAFGANHMHPIDLFLFASIASLVFFPLLGLAPEAGALVIAWLGFNSMFQHANVRTPRWLGYLIQRPEMHCVHHERGRHRSNYANLPLWDLLFGTFENPASVDGREAGFYTGGSTRVVDMLLCRDVSRPPADDDGAEGPVAPAGPARQAA